jgi:hypothetical protein
MRKLLRADGTSMLLGKARTHDEIRELIGCEGTDSRMLADRVHVMIFDDFGVNKNLPINAAATRLYHDAGYLLSQSIHGHAVVVPDSDFAPPALRGKS